MLIQASNFTTPNLFQSAENGHDFHRGIFFGLRGQNSAYIATSTISTGKTAGFISPVFKVIASRFVTKSSKFCMEVSAVGFLQTSCALGRISFQKKSWFTFCQCKVNIRKLSGIDCFVWFIKAFACRMGN